MKVEINSGDLAKIKTLLAGVKNGAPKVLSRSINKTETGVVAESAKLIALSYNLTQKRIKQDFKSKKATVANITGAVTAAGKPLSLTSFIGTSQVVKGVSVRIIRSKPKTILKHAFITTVKGSKQAFWREYQGPRSQKLYQKWKKSPKYAVLPIKFRYKIHRLTGPRIEDEFAKDKTQKAIMNYTDDRFKTVLDQELNFELSKL